MPDMNRRIYRDALLALYNKDEQALQQLGVKEALEKAVVDESLEQNITTNQWGNSTGYSQKVTSFTSNVGVRLGLNPLTALGVADELELHDMATFMEDDVKPDYTKDLDDSNSPGKWFEQGFESVYHYPFDHGVELIHASDREGLAMTADDLDEMERQYISDYGKNTDSIEDMKQSAIRNNNGIKQSLNDNDLFNVSLNAEIDLTAEPTIDLNPIHGTVQIQEQQDESSLEQVTAMLTMFQQNGIANQPVFTTNPVMFESFRTQIRTFAEKWSIKEQELIDNPDHFEAFVSKATEMMDLPNDLPKLDTIDAFKAVRDVVGDQQKQYSKDGVRTFLDGYAVTYQEPVDAVNLTVKEVMASLEDKGVDGVSLEAIDPIVHDLNFKDILSEDPKELNEKIASMKKEIVQEAEQIRLGNDALDSAKANEALEDEGPDL